MLHRNSNTRLSLSWPVENTRVRTCKKLNTSTLSPHAFSLTQSSRVLALRSLPSGIATAVFNTTIFLWDRILKQRAFSVDLCFAFKETACALFERRGVSEPSKMALMPRPGYQRFPPLPHREQGVDLALALVSRRIPFLYPIATLSRLALRELPSLRFEVPAELLLVLRRNAAKSPAKVSGSKVPQLDRPVQSLQLASPPLSI